MFIRKIAQKLYKIYFVVTLISYNLLLYNVGNFIQLFILDESKKLSVWNSLQGFALRTFLSFVGIDTKYSNVPPKSKRFIFASNHTSYLDGFLYSAILRRCLFDIVEPYDKLPFFTRPWLRPLHYVPVFRDKNDEKNYHEGLSKKKAIQESVKNLKKESMLIFPEGHIERHHRFLYFHTGTIRIALQAKINIIPCHIFHSDKVIEYHMAWVKPGVVTIVFGKEWDLSKYYGKHNDHNLVRKLTLELEEKIKKLHPDYKQIYKEEQKLKECKY